MRQSQRQACSCSPAAATTGAPQARPPAAPRTAPTGPSGIRVGRRTGSASSSRSRRPAPPRSSTSAGGHVTPITCGHQPTVSPDGKHLAVVRDFQIYVTDPVGGHARRVTHGLPAQGWADPSWSPDGRRLAFTGKGDYTINGVDTAGADGRGERRLGLGDEPAWAPDGKHILLRDTSNPDLHSRLVLVRADGRSRKRLRHGLDGERPSWSPDGAKIAFASRSRPGPELCTGIYMWSLKSRTVRKVTSAC